MGTAFAPRIKAFVADLHVLQKELIPFYHTPEGLRVYNELLASQRRHFPNYIAEVEGLSDGADIEFYILFLLMVKPEVTTIMNNATRVLACTDLHVNDADCVLGHNEDGSVTAQGRAYVVNATLEYPGQPRVTFWAYTYPGMLPGNAFGFNSFGLVVSENAVFPETANTSEPARYFVSRDAITAQSVSADGLVVGAGTSMNVALDGALRNIEAHSTLAGELAVEPGTFFWHANMFRLLQVPQHSDPSSIHRLARAKMLPTPHTVIDVCAALGDTWDREYPIYRDGAPPDTDVVTLATAVFDLKLGKLSVFVANPNTSEPYMVVGLW